jgi:hypothetical protein
MLAARTSITEDKLVPRYENSGEKLDLGKSARVELMAGFLII